MSLFEKIIIPFIAPELKKLDFTNSVGFKDCYTYVPDNPTRNNEFYIMFDNSVYNEYTIDLFRRLASSYNVKKAYNKVIDNKSYEVYSFFVNPEVSKFYNNLVSLSFDQKNRYVDFWGKLDEDKETVTENSLLALDKKHSMPLAEFVPPPWYIYD